MLVIPIAIAVINPIRRGLNPSFDILLRFVCNPSETIAKRMQYLETVFIE